VHTTTSAQGLTYLLQSKDAHGTWYSTWATVLALKTLALAAERQSIGSGEGEVRVALNDASAYTLSLAGGRTETVQTLSFADLKPGDNIVKLEPTNARNLIYQVVVRYHLPWDQVPPEALQDQALDIAVGYDRLRLAVNEETTATATVWLKRDTQARTVLVKLGVPPGFAVDSGDLEEAVSRGVIRRYEVTGSEAVLYIEDMLPWEKRSLTYRLRAKYPVVAKTPPSLAYDYYNPTTQSTSQPQAVVVALGG
jgi:hypothetical protein